MLSWSIFCDIKSLCLDKKYGAKGLLQVAKIVVLNNYVIKHITDKVITGYHEFTFYPVSDEL